MPLYNTISKPGEYKMSLNLLNESCVKSFIPAVRHRIVEILERIFRQRVWFQVRNIDIG